MIYIRPIFAALCTLVLSSNSIAETFFELNKPFSPIIYQQAAKKGEFLILGKFTENSTNRQSTSPLIDFETIVDPKATFFSLPTDRMDSLFFNAFLILKYSYRSATSYVFEAPTSGDYPANITSPEDLKDIVMLAIPPTFGATHKWQIVFVKNGYYADQAAEISNSGLSRSRLSNQLLFSLEKYYRSSYGKASAFKFGEDPEEIKPFARFE